MSDPQHDGTVRAKGQVVVEALCRQVETLEDEVRSLRAELQVARRERDENYARLATAANLGSKVSQLLLVAENQADDLRKLRDQLDILTSDMPF